MTDKEIELLGEGNAALVGKFPDDEIGEEYNPDEIGLNCPYCGRYRDCEEDCPSRKIKT